MELRTLGETGKLLAQNARLIGQNVDLRAEVRSLRRLAAVGWIAACAGWGAVVWLAMLLMAQ